MKAFSVALFALVALGGAAAQGLTINADVSIDRTLFDELLGKVENGIDNLSNLALDAQSQINSAIATVSGKLQDAQLSITSSLQQSGSVLVKTAGALLSKVVSAATSIVQGLQQSALSANSYFAASVYNQLEALSSLVEGIRTEALNAVSQADINAATDKLRAIALSMDASSDNLTNLVSGIANDVVGLASTAVKALQEIVAVTVSGNLGSLVPTITKNLTILLSQVVSLPSAIISYIGNNAGSFQSNINNIIFEAQAQASNAGIAIP